MAAVSFDPTRPQFADVSEIDGLPFLDPTALRDLFHLHATDILRDARGRSGMPGTATTWTGRARRSDSRPAR